MLLRKKEIRSIIVALLLIFTLITCQLTLVNGAAYGNGDGYRGGSLGTCSGWDCIWAGQVGIRYSLVDMNGDQVDGTHHIDLWDMNKIPTATKNYDLYDGSRLLWDFDNAYYGNQIKQDVILKTPAGLQEGKYFQLSHVQDLNTIFPTISISYERWQPETARRMAEWLEDKTSNENHADMDNLLKALGYSGDGSGKDLSIAAANSEYYIQYEPIILNGRVGSAITNYIFIGTPTEYYKYDQAMSGTRSPWFNKRTTGVFIYLNKAPKYFTTGTGSGVDNLLSTNGSGQIIGEAVAHMWLPDLIDTGAGCTEAIDIINREYTPGTSEYRAQVLKVINGTFEFKEADGTVIKIDGPYTYDNLYEKNYMKLASQQAACTNNLTVYEDCTAAIQYINANYTVGTSEYHKAVAEVRNNTFSRVVINPDDTTTTIRINPTPDYSNASQFPLLVQTNYVNRNGGVASCEKPTCDTSVGSEVYVDDCVTGKTFFGDINDEESWLVCEIAYTDKSGKVYSSDNTGHEAVETTNGGIVGNKDYCELFCYESFETEFPRHVPNVKAGQTFVWGDSTGRFGQIDIYKKCSNQSYIYGVQGYRFEEWKEDYLDNEKTMIKYYMNNASYEIAAKSSFSYQTDFEYTCKEVCSTDCASGASKCDCEYTDCPIWWATATSPSKSKNYTHDASGSNSISVGSVTGSASSQTVTVDGYDSESKAKKAAKEDLITKLEGLAAVEENKYDGKKIDEEELLIKIRQCTNNLEYVYDTVVKFIFEEPINSAYGANTRQFEYKGELKVTGEYNEDNVNTDNCKIINAYSYTCTGEANSATCTPTLEEVLDCTVVTWEINGRYVYTYPVEDFIWYTLKTDSTLLNENKKAELGGNVDDNFFYYVGFGLPTALSLTNGSYYRLKVIVTDLGDNAEIEGAQQYNTEDGHFWPLTDKIPTGEGYGFEYVCSYEVENEIFGYDCRYDDNGNLIYESPAHCDPTENDDSDGYLIEIDVAYRLITLLTDEDDIYKAFPGIDGAGRSRGSNWSLSTYRLHEVLNANIYEDDKAMYEIMLDINAINQIREDNEKYFNSDKDPYTSYYDSNNMQKVFCVTEETEDDERKYCASDFISDLYNQKGLNYPLLGTCLPSGDTRIRAEYVLYNGCDTDYNYPDISWMR